MNTIVEIEQRLAHFIETNIAGCSRDELLQLGEHILEHWISAKGMQATNEKHEGFRLLALQRQGATGDPSFHACRETCRELVYHYNLLTIDDADPAVNKQRLTMMILVANHLCLFVSGKMQVAELGEFCCSSKPIQQDIEYLAEVNDA